MNRHRRTVAILSVLVAAMIAVAVGAVAVAVVISHSRMQGRP